MTPQDGFAYRFDWGVDGLAALAPAAAVLVLVDVLRFTTAVTVAVDRGISVVPGPWEGSTRPWTLSPRWIREHRIIWPCTSAKRSRAFTLRSSRLQFLTVRCRLSAVRSLQSHPLQLPIQRLPLDPQDLRRPTLVPIRRCQHAANLLRLGIGQSLARMIP